MKNEYPKVEISNVWRYPILITMSDKSEIGTHLDIDTTRRLIDRLSRILSRVLESDRVYGVFQRVDIIKPLSQVLESDRANGVFQRVDIIKRQGENNRKIIDALSAKIDKDVMGNLDENGDGLSKRTDKRIDRVVEDRFDIEQLAAPNRRKIGTVAAGLKAITDRVDGHDNDISEMEALAAKEVARCIGMGERMDDIDLAEQFNKVKVNGLHAYIKRIESEIRGTDEENTGLFDTITDRIESLDTSITNSQSTINKRIDDLWEALRIERINRIDHVLRCVNQKMPGGTDTSLTERMDVEVIDALTKRIDELTKYVDDHWHSDESGCCLPD